MEVGKWPRLLLLGLLCPLVRSGCPSNWIKYGGACYYFSKDTATFAQAYPFCAQEQGGLFALPKSSEENKFFGDNTNFLATWLAVSYPLSLVPPRVGEGYSNYDDANNYDQSNEDFVYMYPSQWKNDDCNKKKAFICEAIAPAVSGACLNNYSPLPNPAVTGVETRCYYFHTEGAVTFADAQARCTTEAAYLLSLTNANESHYINAELRARSKASLSQSREFWIGYTRQQEYSTDGDFAWVDKSPRFFTDWYPGQPVANAKNDVRNCACIFPSRWTTVSANPMTDNASILKMGYVCRRGMGAAAATSVWYAVYGLGTYIAGLARAALPF
ncbi:unnamed protein product [Darwinula stevensoni]|uniref:C-type lectin domain-containing protein n=1 Tax=Darwinula stevensoni TaxID=69355 RepID=A0A7R9FR43_9CRUS|nr:unnamed protein product [Darwinula stevensoni]CAG0900921.1 unnamed protein product [Darwinula stevensoni]